MRDISNETKLIFILLSSMSKKYIAYIIVIIQDQAVYQIGILSLCYSHKENEESKKYKHATRNTNQN